MKKSVEELLQEEYWIIDILPEQVPKHSPGQYFAVEEYYLSGPRLEAVRQRHIDTVLKLNCYRDISLDEETELNPPPERIAAAMRSRHVCLMLDGAMLVSRPDDTYMTLYAPDAELLRLIGTIAAGEGLFVWQPPQQA